MALPNFDISKLHVEVLTGGFTIGQSVLGSARLDETAEAHWHDITGDITGLNVDESVDVDSGLFLIPGSQTFELSTFHDPETVLGLYKDSQVRCWYGDPHYNLAAKGISIGDNFYSGNAFPFGDLDHDQALVGLYANGSGVTVGTPTMRIDGYDADAVPVNIGATASMKFPIATGGTNAARFRTLGENCNLSWVGAEGVTAVSGRVWVRWTGRAQTFTFYLYALDATGVSVGSTSGTATASADGVWTEIRCENYTIPVGAAYIATEVRVGTAPVAGDSFSITALTIAPGATMHDYVTANAVVREDPVAFFNEEGTDVVYSAPMLDAMWIGKPDRSGSVLGIQMLFEGVVTDIAHTLTYDTARMRTRRLVGIRGATVDQLNSPVTFDEDAASASPIDGLYYVDGYQLRLEYLLNFITTRPYDLDTITYLGTAGRVAKYATVIPPFPTGTVLTVLDLIKPAVQQSAAFPERYDYNQDGVAEVVLRDYDTPARATRHPRIQLFDSWSEFTWGVDSRWWPNRVELSSSYSQDVTLTRIVDRNAGTLTESIGDARVFLEDTDNGGWQGRAIINAVPLQGEPQEHIQSAKVPFREGSTYLLRAPFIAELTDSTVNESVTLKHVVIGQRHQITPSGWTIEYAFAPEHVWTRQGPTTYAVPTLAAVASYLSDPTVTYLFLEIPDAIVNDPNAKFLAVYLDQDTPYVDGLDTIKPRTITMGHVLPVTGEFERTLRFPIPDAPGDYYLRLPAGVIGTGDGGRFSVAVTGDPTTTGYRAGRFIGGIDY